MDTIAFDYELSRGAVTYSEKLGEWWRQQARNASHRYAYRNIGRYVRASLSQPQTIVDYACGPGYLIAELARQFPDSRITGVDGSKPLLELARKRVLRQRRTVAERVTFIESVLPNFELPREAADAVVFTFPNIVPASDADLERAIRQLSPEDCAVARELAFARDPEDASSNNDDAEVLYSDLLKDRLVALNMRQLLKPGGICFRAEYGNVARDGLSRLEILRTEFEEGALGQAINGRSAEQWFRVVASRYYRSNVMEDVYHQCGEERFKRGGYFITVLKAI